MNWMGLVLGFFLMAMSVLYCISGQFRVGKGSEYITPENHPYLYWGTLIGMGLLGLAIAVATLTCFFRDKRREKSAQ